MLTKGIKINVNFIVSDIFTLRQSAKNCHIHQKQWVYQPLLYLKYLKAKQITMRKIRAVYEARRACNCDYFVCYAEECKTRLFFRAPPPPYIRIYRFLLRGHIYLVSQRSITAAAYIRTYSRAPLRIILFSGKQYNAVSSYQEVCARRCADN